MPQDIDSVPPLSLSAAGSPAAEAVRTAEAARPGEAAWTAKAARTGEAAYTAGPR